MADKPPNAAEIGAELKTLLDYVQDCDRRVHMGEIMDLQGLDRKVIILCEQIAHMPQKEAQGLEGKMGELIAGLEKLANTMRDQQLKISAQGG